MKQFLLVITFIALLCSCGNKQSGIVHLKGRLDLEPPVIMSYNGAASMLGDSRNILLDIDENGNFETSITIDEPAYYSIRRNTIYLTPGDDMEIYINDLNTDARFAGKGSKVNEYMKYRLFPKGGSFLEAGRNIRSSFAETKAVVDSLAALRREQLNALTDASMEFKDLETARINADVVNSYFAYLNYSKYYSSLYRTSAEEYEKQIAMAIDSIALAARPVIRKFNGGKYLDIAVVRDVLSYSNSDAYQKCFEGITLDERTRELYTTSKYISSLREDVTTDKVTEFTALAHQLKNEDFRTEFLGKIEQASRLLPGKPAIDFEMETVDGQKIMLSSFKGKVLYIDLWATWCGPCKKETPYLEKVAERFAGKEIAFIKISTDKRRNDWIKYLEHEVSGMAQYISTDIRLINDWAIVYIPRFILIDKNFNIINAYANRPSEEVIDDVLHNALM